MPMRLLSVLHSPQLNDVGCLDACAQMVLHSVGNQQPQDVLNTALGLTAIGIPYRNILRLSQFGVQVSLLAGEVANLRQAIDNGVPPIVFVKTGDLPYWSANTSHAVVIVGYDEESVFLNDPMFDEAPQCVRWDDFMLAWSEQDYMFAIVSISKPDKR